MKPANKRELALILSAILFIHQFYLPSQAKFLHLDSIHPAKSGDHSDNMLDDSNRNSEPIQTTPVGGEVVEKLTKQVLAKELQLERLNTVFRQQTTQTSNWRQRRMFAYGEGNACMTLSGLLLALPAQYQVAAEKTIKTKNSTVKPHSTPSQRNNLRAGVRMSLIANSYNTGGDLLELGLNFINYCSLRKKGLVPSIYRANVHKLHNEIDNLIKERRVALASVANFSGEDKTTAKVEGKLLDDLRDLYLLEYMDYHSGCKRFWFVQNIAYLTDIAKNVTGGAGNIIALQAYHLHHPNLFGGAGLLTLISGAIILVVPLVGRVTGNISGLAARRTVSQEVADVHTSTTETYSSDLNNF